jgi:hypothetical protein
MIETFRGESYETSGSGTENSTKYRAAGPQRQQAN